MFSLERKRPVSWCLCISSYMETKLKVLQCVCVCPAVSQSFRAWSWESTWTGTRRSLSRPSRLCCCSSSNTSNWTMFIRLHSPHSHTDLTSPFSFSSYIFLFFPHLALCVHTYTQVSLHLPPKFLPLLCSTWLSGQAHHYCSHLSMSAPPPFGAQPPTHISQPSSSSTDIQGREYLD